MFKNKKMIIIILICLIVIAAIIIGAILIMNKSTNNVEEISQEQQAPIEKELENDFRNMLYNFEYGEDDGNNLVSLWYNYEENIEKKYNVNLNIPKINLETEVAARNK